MTTSEFDLDGFRQAIENHWQHHGNCRHLNWLMFRRDDGVQQIEVAPIFQEVYGGEDDGKLVWTGFEFNLTDFLAEPGIEVEDFGACSSCVDCNPRPILAIRGTYEGEPFRPEGEFGAGPGHRSRGAVGHNQARSTTHKGECR